MDIIHAIFIVKISLEFSKREQHVILTPPIVMLEGVHGTVPGIVPDFPLPSTQNEISSPACWAISIGPFDVPDSLV
eukprot:scaffold33102_cov50-Attheya_sp.AAC.2